MMELRRLEKERVQLKKLLSEAQTQLKARRATADEIQAVIQEERRKADNAAQLAHVLGKQVRTRETEAETLGACYKRLKSDGWTMTAPTARGAVSEWLGANAHHLFLCLRVAVRVVVCARAGGMSRGQISGPVRYQCRPTEPYRRSPGAAADPRPEASFLAERRIPVCGNPFAHHRAAADGGGRLCLSPGNAANGTEDSAAGCVFAGSQRSRWVGICSYCNKWMG